MSIFFLLLGTSKNKSLGQTTLLVTRSMLDSSATQDVHPTLISAYAGSSLPIFSKVLSKGVDHTLLAITIFPNL